MTDPDPRALLEGAHRRWNLGGPDREHYSKVGSRWPGNLLQWPGVELSHQMIPGAGVRRVIQVLGIALMTAGLLLDNSMRRRHRRAGGTADQRLTSRLPLPLFWIGAALLVLASI
jgi:hypothetical protein